MRKKALYVFAAHLLIFTLIFFQVSYEVVMASHQPAREKPTASAVSRTGDFSLGVALSPEGGAGNEVMDIDVAGNARSLVVGLGGLSLVQNPDGVTLRVLDPQGRAAESVVRPLQVDKALESQMNSWARNVIGKEKFSADLLTEAKINELITKYPFNPELKNRAQAVISAVQTTPNLGVIGRDEKGVVRNVVIFNPTPGKWKVEVNAKPNAKPFQAIATSVPRAGMPQNIEPAGREIVDRLNRKLPSFQKRSIKWGCNKCCWCENLVGFGICFAIATYICTGGYVTAAILLSAAFWKMGGMAISYVALSLFLASKVPTPPNSVWDVIQGWIMDSLIRYACKLARCC